MLDTGAYDFREATLNIVATTLRDQKNVSAAVEILKLNAEMFPRSVGVQLTLGDAAAQAGDAATARAAFRHALEIEPGNARATAALAALDKPK